MIKSVKSNWIGIIFLMAGVSLACRLTSPTPAAWSGTPSAEARNATNTAFALTQDIKTGSGTQMPTTAQTPTTEPFTPTIQSTAPIDGPWLVFPAVDASALIAYDLDAKVMIEIPLPAPIITSDLGRGLSPDGHTVVVRAGSEFNTDELGIYWIDLPSGTVTQLTPLLSITNQRKLVNEEGSRVFQTLNAVTREDGLAWSPDGRYLAFIAALENNTADLYVLDLEKGRLERLNGVYSQSASPFWSPGSNWLVTQELEDFDAELGWRSESVTGLRFPGYDGQNTLYLPVKGSIEEVFLGWANAHSFLSYSRTPTSMTALRQVDIDTLSVGMIYAEAFSQAAVDPASGALALVLDETQALNQGKISGVYLRKAGSAVFELQQAGAWSALAWDAGGVFVASGQQGVSVITPEGNAILLTGESGLSISPSGNWMIGWGDGDTKDSGARLYQSPSGNLLQSLTDLQVTSVYWQPDSKAFFMLAEGALYRVAFPGLNLEEIIAGYPAGQPLELVWVE
jgi:WD40 repeat protein